MGGIYVFLSLTLVITFIMTRISVVKISYDGVLNIELHLIFLAIILTANTEKQANKKSYSINNKAIFTARRVIINLLPHADITVHRVRVSDKAQSFNRSAFTRPYRYHIAISTLIAYLGVKARKLKIDADAVTWVSDPNQHIEFYVTIRIMLFHLLFELLKLLYMLKGKRKEDRDVRI